MKAPDAPVATERLWLTEPRRSTALAKVVAVSGHAFALDRSLFAPASVFHRHPQPADKGTIWLAGEKRKLERVFQRDGVLWHQLRGTVPDAGEQAQCQLDADRRLEASRAHTAMHLLMAALHRANAPPMVRNPEVRGGGHFRLDLAGPVAPKDLAACLAQARQWGKDDRPVAREHVARGGHEAKVLDVQRFQPPDPYPGPPTVMDVAVITGVCSYPCDGTLVERTGKVGEVVLPQANATRSGFSIVGRVRD
ncbi:MAG: alanyl-tRNA synthetase [Thermoplasmata archaeon]|nr:alanyl-tRNA synthetase [Thermoplasmata archaeon]